MKLSIVPIVLLAVQATALAQSNSKCSDMGKFRSPGVTLEITRAEIVPAGRVPGARGGPAGPALPAHCRIDGMMDRRTGTDGRPTESALPSRFPRIGQDNTCSRAAAV